MKLIQRPAALLLLLAWLPLATSLVPLPTIENAESASRAVMDLAENGKKARKFLDETGRTEMEESLKLWANPKEVQSLWFTNWIMVLFVFALGLVASVMAVSNISKWRLAVLVSSLIYLAIGFNFSESYIPSWESAQRWWMLATQLNNGVLVVYKDLLFPLIQFTLLVTMASFLIRENIRSKKHET